MSRPAEEPFFFEHEGSALFGVIHEAAAGVARRTPFVFCHAFGEEKLWTHRVLVSFARRLAALGHPVLRCDYRGNGDSEGAFGDSSLDTMCADVRRAVAELRRRTGAPSVALLGLRLGAAVASVVADTQADVERLILWAPITDGARYMQDLLRINVMTQTATYKEVRYDREQLVAMLREGQLVNVDGYEMGLAMYATVSALDISAAAHAFGRDCLIVQVEPRQRPAPDLQRLAAAYSAATLTFAAEEPFWKEIPQFYQDAPNLFRATTEWLEGAAAPARPAAAPASS
jgi:exosortase A-associated hydrolase 2